MELKTFLQTIPLTERDTFARRCGTSFRHLQNVAYGKTCGESLAINIERESGREVTCEELRPDVDWAAIRGTAPTERAA